MSWDVDRWMTEVLERAGEFADPVPAEVLARWSLTGRTVAFHDIHQPETMAAAMEARRRLVFDELLRVQLTLVQRKRELERTTPGIRHQLGRPRGSPAGSGLVERFHERLGFALTGAQQRAIAEIDADLAGPHPMHRLLQGDVGSGKTIVAVSAPAGGHPGRPPGGAHGAHRGAGRAAPPGGAGPARGLRRARHRRVEPVRRAPGSSVSCGWSCSPTAPPRPSGVASWPGWPSGEVDLAIGTHALIQEGIEFRSLGVVVIDEQHRFGVEQRAALRDKGAGAAVPDVLVMTATPIPRTAAMTVYGDLDVSVLDELPPGRTPIVTTWARDGELDEEAVWAAVREQVAAGRQAYVVCPLIDESEKLEVRSAEETFERLAADDLSGLRLGLLHGRVSPGEKQLTMDLFRSGGLDVLVATTVIEVGVDVPNATVMVILDADRFGIAQLHQLRGRVGRGHDQSYCYLVGEATTADGEARLEAMVRTTDGFELAEVDLDLRGEGTIMGERQKGRNDLRLASLRRDREWVGRARDVAFELVDADPDLVGHPVLAEEIGVVLGDDESRRLPVEVVAEATAGDVRARWWRRRRSRR